ncbi:MAG TPA: hypothetical protein PLG47_04390 [Candidatus Dojkabacteria bacterium]|nr:hypothetical protein [Candidatus Dojkabacteria bacterium]
MENKTKKFIVRKKSTKNAIVDEPTTSKKAKKEEEKEKKVKYLYPEGLDAQGKKLYRAKIRSRLEKLNSNLFILTQEGEDKKAKEALKELEEYKKTVIL